MGHPVTAGDPTLVEWLDQLFDVYIRQAGVSDVDKAVVILDHLGGCAREEVLCHPDAVRHLKRFNKLPSRAKLQTACEQGSLWLIECSLKKIKYTRL